MAILLLVGDVAPALHGPLAGTISDRFDLKRVMVSCELAQAGLMAVIALWLPSLPVLLAVVALRAIAGQIFQPVSRAAVPGLVADRHLKGANAAMGIGTNGRSTWPAARRGVGARPGHAWRSAPRGRPLCRLGGTAYVPAVRTTCRSRAAAGRGRRWAVHRIRTAHPAAPPGRDGDAAADRLRDQQRGNFLTGLAWAVATAFVVQAIRGWASPPWTSP
ncbi:MAG: hypothetical protein M3143_00815 [Actinomycetota bacterium]|nr:hypothetical protein [Actinomycetota bacterium]